MVNRSKMKYRAEYSQIVEDWRRSGLSRADYSRLHGYHPNTFDGWIKKMNRSAGQSKRAKIKVRVLKKEIQTHGSVFMPLKIENAPPAGISPTFECTIPVQSIDKPGGTIKGYHWIFKSISPHLTFFYYNKGSRSQRILQEVLPGFQGAAQCDGYQGYEQLDNIKGVITIGCWAHARRKFEQALDNDPGRANYALAEIKKLYDIERYATEANCSFDQIKALRAEKSFPILKDFEQWMLEQAAQVLPKSPIGKAILYARGMYRRLVRYTLDGRYRIDNNLAENAVRPLALGRKNYLFCGNHQAAERTAIIYSLMGTCIANNVNPQEWLTDILNRIQDHNIQKLDELLPHNWKLNKASSNK